MGFVVVLVAWVFGTKGHTSSVYLMDDHDHIIGQMVVHLDYHSIEQLGLPAIPKETSQEIKSAAESQFPFGSPNVTVDGPWRKHVSTCSHSHDSYLTHYFAETEFVWSNDVCALPSGTYTWILTSDYQLSFGRYENNYELGSKHSNIAMKRSGFVAGELLVSSGSLQSKRIIGWNLLSGTYSEPISASMNESYPDAYLEEVLRPKMDQVWKASNCSDDLFYQNSEFFFPVLPSNEYVGWACANNPFVRNYSSLVWDDSSVSVCDDWHPLTCVHKRSSTF